MAKLQRNLHNLTEVGPIQRLLEHELLEAFADQAEASLVARWLLEDRLQLSHAQLLAYPELPVSESHKAQLQEDLAALRQGWPPQYVIGHVHFLDHTLMVKPGVFIPRPETEELAHRLIKQQNFPSGPILDIGAGTGCLAISLSGAFPHLAVLALEASDEAQAVLEANITRNQVGVRPFTGSILHLESLPEELKQPYGLMVSNPPYVTQMEKNAMANRVTAYEPHQALFVPDDDPLLFYRAIAELASVYLCKGGLLAMEVNAAYAQQVATLLQDHQMEAVTVLTDLQGAARYVWAWRSTT